jgi:hypothetical protein
MLGKIITGAFAVVAGLTLAACSLGAQQPRTAAGARAAARTFFNVYATSQWAAAYQLLSPAAQHAVSEATWAKAQQGCPNQGVEMAGTIKSVTLAGNTAMVRATPPPGGAGWVFTVQEFTYSEGRWGYSPYSLDIYRGHIVSQIVAALKAEGYCDA